MYFDGDLFDDQKTSNKSVYETSALENAEQVKQTIENATKEKHRKLEERLAKKKAQLAKEAKRKEDRAAAAQAEIEKRDKMREETAAKEASDAKRVAALAIEEEKVAYDQIAVAEERKKRMVEERHRKLKERLARKKQEQAQEAQRQIEEQKLAMERATAERLKQERLAVELHNSRLAAAGAKFKALENSYKEKQRRKLDQEAQEAEAARVAEKIAHEEHLLELSKMRQAAEAEEILQKQRLLELTKSLENVEAQMGVSHEELVEALHQKHLDEVQALKEKLLPEHIVPLEKKHRNTLAQLKQEMLPEHVQREREESIKLEHAKEIQLLKDKLLPEHPQIRAMQQEHEQEIADIQFVETLAQDENQKTALTAESLPKNSQLDAPHQRERNTLVELKTTDLPMMEEELAQKHEEETRVAETKLEEKQAAETNEMKKMLTPVTMLEDRNVDGAMTPASAKRSTHPVIIVPDDTIPLDSVRHATDNTCSSIDGMSVTTDATFEVGENPEDEPSDLDIALALMRGDEYQPKQKPDPPVVDEDLRPTDNDSRLQEIEKRMEEDRERMEALEKSMDQMDHTKATSPCMTDEDEDMLRVTAACLIQCVWRGTHFRRTNKYMIIGIKRLTMRALRLRNIKKRQGEEIEAQRREFKGLELVVAREQKACRRLEQIAFRKSIHETVTSPSRATAGNVPVPFTVQSQHTARKKAELSVQEAHGKIRRMSHKIKQLLNKLNMSKAEHKAEAEKEISKMRNEMIHHSKRSESEISRLGAIVETMGRDPDLNRTLHRQKLPPKTSAVQTDVMTDTLDLGRRGLQKHKVVMLPTIREQITPAVSSQKSRQSMQSGPEIVKSPLLHRVTMVGDEASGRGKQIRVLTFDAPSTLSSPAASTRIGTSSPVSSPDLKSHQASQHRTHKVLTAAGLGVSYEPGTISPQDLRKIYL